MCVSACTYRPIAVCISISVYQTLLYISVIVWRTWAGTMTVKKIEKQSKRKSFASCFMEHYKAKSIHIITALSDEWGQLCVYIFHARSTQQAWLKPTELAHFMLKHHSNRKLLRGLMKVTSTPATEHHPQEWRSTSAHHALKGYYSRLQKFEHVILHVFFTFYVQIIYHREQTRI